MRRIGWVALAAGLSAVPGSAAPNILFVFPRAACVVQDRNNGGQYPLWQNLFYQYGDSSVYAEFGYVSFQSTAASIPLGSNNIFVQDPQFRNQPATFNPGFHPYAFGTTFDPSIGLSWFLNGASGASGGGAFATADTSLPACPGMSANGTPLPAQFAPVGLASGQTVRLSVVATPGAGSCPATLSFADALGNPIRSNVVGGIGPAEAAVNPGPGQVSYIELFGSANTTPGHRILVQPRFTTSFPDSCQASVEVYATATGVTAATTRPIQPLYQYALDPQSLSAGQTLRVNLAASASQSCGAVVSLADSSGNPLPNSTNPLTLSRTLQPGAAAYLDLPSASLPGLTGWSGGHVPVVPTVLTMATRNGNTIGLRSSQLHNGATNDVLVSETCFASLEIYDTLTGYTRTLANPQPLH